MKRLKRRRLKRAALLLSAGLALVMIAAGGWLYYQLNGSLAQLDGVRQLSGLSAPVVVHRDALGVPTLRGENRFDLARALGFLHAQERFFQMDLLRRSGAGELAELFGEAALAIDLEHRLHRFRARARIVNAALPAADQRLLEAYTAGVNSGLQALRAPPFEYVLLGTSPVPWRAEDTALIIYAMYLDLQGEDWLAEAVQALLYDLLPEPVYAFLTPRGTEWDAPLQGGAFTPPPPPGPEFIDLRTLPLPPSLAKTTSYPYSRAFYGSNNWAMAGSHSAHGGALLANDMHLRLQVPNIWYRASLVHGERRVTGVTLPGTPAIVAGSNGEIAWGYTNANGDWADLVIVEDAGEDAYLTADGRRSFQRYRETIRVRDGEDRHLHILETVWGPLIDSDHRGRRRALRWVAHAPQALDLQLMHLETAATVEQALHIANRAGAPAQNVVVADRAGRIGWTVSGPIPRRIGYEGRLPQFGSDAAKRWDGWLTPEQYPRIIDPSEGRLWTANARTVAGYDLAKLGFGRYVLGARAKQIRDRLFALEGADEAAMLAIQLDDRALFLRRWRDLLLEVLTEQAIRDEPRRKDLRDAVERWGGRAATDSVGYRAVHDFRVTVARWSAEPIDALCRQADERCDLGLLTQSEGPLWALVSQRPEHMLNPRFGDWRALLLAAADTVLENMEGAADYTWGAYNTSRIHHPLSRLIPLIGDWLNMPDLPMPGGRDMPRVQGPTAGASQRLVVSPGREERGLFHMPGGQSSHPLSPFYRAGHEAWVRGEPLPFLPGPTAHTLTLAPTLRANKRTDKDE